MNAWWSYILAPFGLAGMYLAGRKIAKGWLLSIGTQLLWLAYAVQTRQWGFIPGSGAYLVVYARNWSAWRKTKEEQ